MPVSLSRLLLIQLSLIDPEEPQTQPPAPLPAFLTSVQNLLSQTTLCNYAVRVSMTQKYNALLEAFCALHPDILRFVDINSGLVDGTTGEVRVMDFADPIDPTK